MIADLDSYLYQYGLVKLLIFIPYEYDDRTKQYSTISLAYILYYSLP